MKAATDALPDLKQFVEQHPKEYHWYVGALRLARKIRESPEPLTLNFTMQTDGSAFVRHSRISSWTYEGDVDEYGNACGYGVASATQTSKNEWKRETISGTFRDGEPFGIIVYEAKYQSTPGMIGCIRSVLAGEVWGQKIGRSTIYL